MQSQARSRVVLHQAVEGHERSYSLPRQRPMELGQTGRALALVLPCDRPTVEREQDLATSLSSRLVLISPAPQVRYPSGHTSDTTSPAVFHQLVIDVGSIR